MTISKCEFEKILKESPLYDPREIAQDIMEIAERNRIEVCEPFLERHLNTISAIVVIAAALYFGGHWIAFLLMR
ncbi:MAG: hypothetical protein A2X55_09015 [Nitrospirae bacterium GWB2_47_37]|nr:MAG: hypothetical protein A2Z82_02515 [Nitrospirae bacterium GWA2_46_11]OGW23105.1 MAG: hypothetical protein A2X55_09015 [Nitrospirae bacterium GWB2_47_37]HAK87651.1 hypothetical protein [Nitrospiraceae bacterium]